MSKKIPQKKTDLLIIGESASAAVLAILAGTKKSVVTGKKVYFLSNNIASVDDTKIFFKSAIVLTEPTSELASSPLSIPMLLTESTGKGETVIIGSENTAIKKSIQISERHKVSIVCPGATILNTHDKAVQEVVSRYLKKLKITVLDGHSVVSSRPSERGTYDLVIEKDGMPKRLSVDTVYAEPIDKYLEDFGSQNLGKVGKSKYTPGMIAAKISKNILVVYDNQDISIETARRILGLAVSRKISSIALPTHNVFLSSDIMYFSIGMLEQEFDSSHHAYKRSVVAVPTQGREFKSFVKVTTSMSGKVLGICGVLPTAKLDPSLLYPVVDRGQGIQELLRTIYCGHPLAKTFIEIAKELGK